MREWFRRKRCHHLSGTLTLYCILHFYSCNTYMWLQGEITLKKKREIFFQVQFHVLFMIMRPPKKMGEMYFVTKPLQRTKSCTQFHCDTFISSAVRMIIGKKELLAFLSLFMEQLIHAIKFGRKLFHQSLIIKQIHSEVNDECLCRLPWLSWIPLFTEESVSDRSVQPWSLLPNHFLHFIAQTLTDILQPVDQAPCN